MRALGLDYDCKQINLDDGGMFPVCGIIKDYHRGSAETSKNPEYLDIAWIKEMEMEDDFRMLRPIMHDNTQKKLH